jgi:hypothetical protein
MPAAAATANMATAAEASDVPATAKAAHMAAAERPVVTVTHVMVFPRMVDREARRVASRIDWPSIGIRSIAISRIAIVAISRFAASAHPAAE